MRPKKLTYDEWMSMLGQDPLDRAALINQNTELSRHCFTLKCELARTKRALWLARAKRAKELQWLNGSKWVIVEQKCRAYADKFKEEK